MKYLGIDYGDKNIGIAISNSSGTMAFPYDVIPNDSNSIETILQMVEQNDVTTIVIGKPTNLNGEDSVATTKALAFYTSIKKRFDNTVLFDERLTTSLAHVIGGQMGVNNKKRKEDVDKIAASIILNDYLEKVGRERHD